MALKFWIERRKYFKSPNKERYNELVLYFIEEMEKCLNQNCLILAEARDVSREKFEKSCLFWIEEGFMKDMLRIQANAYHKIKYFLSVFVENALKGR